MTRAQHIEFVALIDDTPFFLVEKGEMTSLKSWTPEGGVQHWYGSTPDDLIDFHVIGGDLFFVQTDYVGDETALLRIDLDTSATTMISNQHIVDIYQDWFA